MRGTLGTDEEYSGSGKKHRSKGLRAFYPLIGLILAAAFGAIAFVLGQPIADSLANSGLFAGVYGDDYVTVTWIVRGVIFFVLVLIGALLFSFAAPKPKGSTGVTERGMDKERKERLAAELEAKKRRKKVRNELAKARKNQSGR